MSFADRVNQAGNAFVQWAGFENDDPRAIEKMARLGAVIAGVMNVAGAVLFAIVAATSPTGAGLVFALLGVGLCALNAIALYDIYAITNQALTTKKDAAGLWAKAKQVGSAVVGGVEGVVQSDSIEGASFSAYRRLYSQAAQDSRTILIDKKVVQWAFDTARPLFVKS